MLDCPPNFPKPLYLHPLPTKSDVFATCRVSGMSLPSGPSRPTASGMSTGRLVAWPGLGGVCCLVLTVKVRAEAS